MRTTVDQEISMRNMTESDIRLAKRTGLNRLIRHIHLHIQKLYQSVADVIKFHLVRRQRMKKGNRKIIVMPLKSTSDHSMHCRASRYHHSLVPGWHEWRGINESVRHPSRSRCYCSIDSGFQHPSNMSKTRRVTNAKNFRGILT